MKIKTIIMLFFLFFFPFSAFAESIDNSEYEKELKKIQKAIYEDVVETETTSMNVRINALKDIAYSYGMQKGVKFRYNQIIAQLEKRSFELDKVYDFSFLLIEGQVVPPVIIGAEDYVSVNNKKASKILQSYIIKEQPRFVSVAPSWRDYLFFAEIEKDIKLDKVLLPRNSEEKEVVEREIAKGFNDGISHANYIYEINFNKLNRDYKGMILFHKLALKNIISIPKINRGDLGIIIKGNELKIGETKFSVEDSSFNNPSKWSVK